MLAVDPASAADRHQKAAAARTIERMPQPDGMESLLGHHAGRGRRRPVGHPDRRRQGRPGRPRAGAGLPDPGLDALRVDALVHAMLHNGGADPADPLLTTTDPAGADRDRAAGGHAGAGCRSAPAAARRPPRW